MKFSELMANMTRNANRTKLIVKKHSPEILMAAGTLGVIASTVILCKETKQLDDVLDESRCEIEDLKLTLATNSEYSEKQYRKDLTRAYAVTAKDLVRLYTPGATLWTVSMSMIFASNITLHKRNASLAAAYAAVDSAFRFYRANVKKELGEDADRKFRYGIHEEEIEVVETDKNGKEKKVKKKVEVIDEKALSEYSMYARFFDESCFDWDPDPEYNFTFLKAQENYANDVLKARGHLFLNEVYDMLGISRSKAGQIVGWIYDKDNPVGDNYVDFGIFTNNEANRAFVNGTEPTILLDFNVDGNIYDKI